MEGRFVSLRPIQQDDMAWLFRLATLPETIYRWRLRGRTPTPQTFPAGLTRNTLLQYVIQRRNSDERVGLIDAYNAQLENQTIFVSLIIEPARQKSGWPMEGPLLLLELLFSGWNFRKVYFEGMSSSMSHLTEVARYEGALIGHEFDGGRYVDWSVYAIYRADWIESGYGKFVGNI